MYYDYDVVRYEVLYSGVVYIYGDLMFSILIHFFIQNICKYVFHLLNGLILLCSMTMSLCHIIIILQYNVQLCISSHLIYYLQCNVRSTAASSTQDIQQQQP